MKYEDFRGPLLNMRDCLTNIMNTVTYLIKDSSAAITFTGYLMERIQNLTLMLTLISPSFDLRRGAYLTRYLAQLDTLRALLELIDE